MSWFLTHPQHVTSYIIQPNTTIQLIEIKRENYYKQ